MAEVSDRNRSFDGLWKNNPALVQLLGLCPLLAVSTGVVNAFGLGLATMMVLVLSNASVSLIRNAIPDTVRLPIFVMIIAAAVTCMELVMQAFAYGLFQVLGIFLPLIATNCVILGRADGFAARNPLGASVCDALCMGLGFVFVLVLLGGLREVIGTGALFANMDLLFGPGAAHWKIVLPGDYQPFLLATLPPGAFIFTGLIIAVKNTIDDRMKRREAAHKVQVVKGAKRVRVTGTIS